MKHPISLVASAAVCFAALATARDAAALGPVDLEVGARIGGATTPFDGGQDPLGFGLGGRAGLTFGGGLYAGASVIYYFGYGQSPRGSYPPGVGSAAADLSQNTLMYGVELGYGVTLLDILTIRPQVGIGNATVHTGSDFGQDQDVSYWYLEPGATVLVGLGRFYVGTDVNALIFPSLTYSQAALSVHGQVGVKF